MKTPPLVLIFSALDGTGGAGIVADCRAVTAAGALPLVISTGIAAQNLDGVLQFWRTPSSQIRGQFAALKNAPVAAVKIGVVGEVAPVVECVRDLGDVPVIWDPVLSPTFGAPFADKTQIRRLRKQLLPLTSVVTPNRKELTTLGESQTSAVAMRALFDGGARMILVTDTHPGARVRCALHDSAAGRPLWTGECRRRRGEFHGGGCWLSSAFAARLAAGDSPKSAATKAHKITLSAIEKAFRVPKLGRQHLLFSG